jgi:hypothetical protein
MAAAPRHLYQVKANVVSPRPGAVEPFSSLTVTVYADSIEGALAQVKQLAGDHVLETRDVVTVQ